MSKQQQAEDKITTALLLLSAAAETLLETIVHELPNDYTPEEHQANKRIMQISAAVTFLAPEVMQAAEQLDDPAASQTKTLYIGKQGEA